MTNQMIIFWASVELMEQGILKPTGEKIVVKDQDGKDKELDMPEEIHTYQHWKDLGYQVQKGQKSIAKFPVWKHTGGKMEKMIDTEGNEQEVPDRGRMFMKTAAFFSRSQVEEITAEA